MKKGESYNIKKANTVRVHKMLLKSEHELVFFLENF